jgi:predicted nucleic acid-binding protein
MEGDRPFFIVLSRSFWTIGIGVRPTIHKIMFSSILFREGFISQVKPILDRLRCTEIRTSERLIQKALQLAGEAE